MLFGVLRAVIMKPAICWNIIPCAPTELCLSFRGSCCYCFHCHDIYINEPINWKCLRTEIILRTDAVRAVSKAVASFSPHRIGFYVRILHVEFVAGKMTPEVSFVGTLLLCFVMYLFIHHQHYIILATECSIKCSTFSRPDLKKAALLQVQPQQFVSSGWIQ
jgi:hypothetical protein